MLPGLVLLHVGALDDVGAVKHHRVDAQLLAALHYRLSGTAIKGDSLGGLAGQSLVLDEENVGQGMAGADDRHRAPVRALFAVGQLAAELVDVGDGTGQVLVINIIRLWQLWSPGVMNLAL